MSREGVVRGETVSEQIKEQNRIIQEGEATDVKGLTSDLTHHCGCSVESTVKGPLWRAAVRTRWEPMMMGTKWGAQEDTQMLNSRIQSK